MSTGLNQYAVYRLRRDIKETRSLRNQSSVRKRRRPGPAGKREPARRDLPRQQVYRIRILSSS